jgi:predicted aconitase with swiveling domain
MIYGFKEDIIKEIRSGDWIRVDTDQGAVEVIKKGA